jgi:hypothetical protein
MANPGPMANGVDEKLAANYAALEQERENLQKLKAEMEKSFQTQLKQQVQQQVAAQVPLKVKEKIEKSKHPHDFVGINAREKLTWTCHDDSVGDILKNAGTFLHLADSGVGMVESKELLPEKTSEDGLAEIDQQIATKTKRLRETWERIHTKIRKTRAKYKAIATLRHKRLKYEKKLKSQIKSGEVKRAKKEEIKGLKYIDDEAEEDMADDGDYR